MRHPQAVIVPQHEVSCACFLFRLTGVFLKSQVFFFSSNENKTGGYICHYRLYRQIVGMMDLKYSCV